MEKQLVSMPIASLRHYKNNPRHNDQAVEAVMESIRQCEYIAPIIVDEDLVILAGHTRATALERMGRTEAEVMIVSGLTEEQKKKYRLLDNKTNELATWDDDLLKLELEDLDFGDFDFGFDLMGDWFSSRERNDTSRQEGNDEYNEFLDKFEAKKTTDDCYTPDLVYEAVADWVANEYNLDRKNFVRPFYPGGDYQNEKYRAEDVVVDNPPFSILAEILRWYDEHGVKFFLFGPTLTLFSSSSSSCCAIPTGVGVTYENNAIVNTSFLTNLEDLRVRTAPTLYQAVKEANEQERAKLSKELPTYSYPDEVITSAMVARWSKYGIDFKLTRRESRNVDALDSQKEEGKAIFGKGYLLSERAAAERAAAERAAAERAAAERAAAHRWPLSDREKAIVRELSNR